ncbi:Hypothetical protein PBC10988_31810 [Planctomycetales bacterium 10988]|nr:Hypothetical protein PBC10988_31810 [Planctomycetales bacterium 10988]
MASSQSFVWMVALSLGLGFHCLGCQSSPLTSGFRQASNDSIREPSQSQFEPTSIAELFEAAEEAERQANYKQAIQYYHSIEGKDPAFAGSVQFSLAQLYDEIGAHQSAWDAYQKAFAMEPNRVDLLTAISHHYYRRGDFISAECWSERALSLDPQNEDAKERLAWALAQQGEYDRSLELFETILPPADANARMGSILASHGRPRAAEQAFQVALKLDQNQPQAQRYLASWQGVSPKTPTQLAQQSITANR